STLTRPSRIRSACAINSGPFSASRAAAVAITCTRVTFIWSMSPRKRRSARSARATASADSRPVDTIERPSPHRIFSLNSTAGARMAFSLTTSRTAFDPISTTAMGLVSCSRDILSMASPIASTRLGCRRETQRHIFFQRCPPSGQARIGHEIFLGAERFLTRRRLDSLRAPIAPYPPALHIVLHVRDHDLIENLLVHRRVLDRHHHFDAAVEIARHHVCRADIDHGLAVRQPMARAEAINAGMLQEAPDDALHLDALGKVRHARTQAANSTHHQI